MPWLAVAAGLVLLALGGLGLIAIQLFRQLVQVGREAAELATRLGGAAQALQESLADSAAKPAAATYDRDSAATKRGGRWTWARQRSSSWRS